MKNLRGIRRRDREDGVELTPALHSPSHHSLDDKAADFPRASGKDDHAPREVPPPADLPLQSPQGAATAEDPADAPHHGRMFLTKKGSTARKQPGQTHTGFAAVHSVGFTEEPNERFRATMEDAHVIVDSFRGRDAEAFFAIYDGHGGRKAVDLVRKHLHKLFEREIAREPCDPPKAFFQAYMRADKVLLENECQNNGTTSVTCYVTRDGDDRVLWTANVGDARAVLSDGKSTAVRLSYDHKATDESETKRVTEGGGFVAARRVNGVLSVSRALGDHAMKSVVIPAPHITRWSLSRDIEDQFLLLACDGLWDVVTDEEAMRFVADKYSMGMDVQQISRRLVKAALENGSTDNISVMVIKL